MPRFKNVCGELVQFTAEEEAARNAEELVWTQNAQARALEAASMAAPLVMEGHIWQDTGVHERYETIPVMLDGSEPRCVMVILGVPIPLVGERWHVEFEYLVTNNTLRDRGKGAFATSFARLDVDTSHDQTSGVEIVKAIGGGNLGVEVHHRLCNRVRNYVWTQSRRDALMAALGANPPASLVLKVFCRSASTAAIEGQDVLEFTMGKGVLTLIRFPRRH